MLSQVGLPQPTGDINLLTLVNLHLFNLNPHKLLFSLPSHHNVLFSSKLLNFDRKVVKLLTSPFLRVSGREFYPIVLILGLGLEPSRFQLSVYLNLLFQLFYSLGCLEGSLVKPFSGSRDAYQSSFRPVIGPLLGLERSRCRLAHRLGNRLITR